jgi:uncharacterized coiled-coil protein SlyX
MKNSQTIQELKNEAMSSKQAIAKMEGQIGQLANQVGERERGKFPSQPVPNPKGQFVLGNTSAPSHG